MHSASRETTGARCSSRQECREVIAQKRTVVGPRMFARDEWTLWHGALPDHNQW
jgi:hypothetical protein